MFTAKDNNATVTVKGDKMTIEVDLSKNLGKSSTGKSDMIATSRGYVPVETDDGQVKVSFNIVKK